MKKRPLVILTGPTAVGKTKLSVELAKRIGGEILSADSMQVYRHMDIGSAKIRSDEMEGIPHHLLDILEPWEEFNVVVFQQKCKECLEQIYDSGHIPILVGGTGFYIQAVLYDVDFTENGESDYRKNLEALSQTPEGPAELHRRLLLVDPDAALAIHQNNVKRTIRALEFYHLTGQKISEHNNMQREKEAAFNSCFFVLTDNRQKLYERIDDRVDQMLSDGLVDEVKRLKDLGCHRNMVSMQGLGYKEILAFLDGEITLEEAVYQLKRDTRHFAKRQLTWFRREKDILWIDKEQFDYSDDKILDYMIESIQEKRIHINDEC